MTLVHQVTGSVLRLDQFRILAVPQDYGDRLSRTVDLEMLPLDGYLMKDVPEVCLGRGGGNRHQLHSLMAFAHGSPLVLINRVNQLTLTRLRPRVNDFCPQRKGFIPTA